MPVARPHRRSPVAPGGAPRAATGLALTLRLALALALTLGVAAGCARTPPAAHRPAPAPVAPATSPPRAAQAGPRPGQPAVSPLAAVAAVGERIPGGPYRARFEHSGRRLTVELLDDALVHVEVAPAGVPTRPLGEPLAHTPMVVKQRHRGPSRVQRQGARIETPRVTVLVDERRLCVTLSERPSGQRLTTVCPSWPSAAEGGPARLAVDAGAAAHAYGLGQELLSPGVTDGHWRGLVRSPGSAFGNAMNGFDGGAAGNTQIPVLHVLGPAAPGGRTSAHALFVDSVARQRWDLGEHPWQVEVGPPRGSAPIAAGELPAARRPLRYYLAAGGSLDELRRTYLALVGRPPVPPRRAFGLWVSEYGYDGWEELMGKLRSLRQHRFPIDGFVLDLQWYGGIHKGTDASRMGSLTFDTRRFPDPAGTISRLRTRHGVGLIPIEQSYVARALPEHARLAASGFLVRDGRSGQPLYLEENPWWGRGGMLDWSSPAGADHWHDWKRKPLVDLGVVGHWTDLGEPEVYSEHARYHGIAGIGRRHADVHNLYNLLWAESIARGYSRHREARRPFILSRSGTAGIQRYGVAMWSGDVGTRFTTLAAQQRAQLHVALSGIDYYGSDVGGFHRGTLRGAALDELYTRWFANAAMLDVPLRPHTENLCNCKETSPDRIGHRASNLANLRLRYALLPYVYSLAHAAATDGEAVFPPPVLHFPADPAVREMGHQKMIGRDLLVAVATRAGERSRDVYLPAGTWYDFHEHRAHPSRGEWLRGVSFFRRGLFRLPLYAREGAIVPLAHVDAGTLNALGERRDGGRRDDLIVRVHAGPGPTHFTLVEDDGETVAYRRGEVRRTRIVQQLAGNVARVEVRPAQGTYARAPAARDLIVELVAPRRVVSAWLDRSALPRARTRAALERAAEGAYVVERDGLVVARVPARPVTTGAVLQFSLAR